MLQEQQIFMAIHRKPFNVDIDEGIAESFQKFIDSTGLSKYRVLQAAIRAYLALPPDLQLRLTNPDTDDIYAILVRSIIERETQKHLEELGPAKEEFLLLLKQAKAKVVRKK